MAGFVTGVPVGGAVIGGMLAATGIAIFMIPVSFYVIERLSHRGKTDPLPAESAGTDDKPAAGKEGDGHA